MSNPWEIDRRVSNPRVPRRSTDVNGHLKTQVEVEVEVRVRVRVGLGLGLGLGSLLMYVKSRNMLKLRKTELKSEKGKVCECSKSDTKIGIVPC